MGYYRNVVAKRLLVKLVSLALDDDRAVLRFLAPLSPSDFSVPRACENLDELLTTKKLAQAKVFIEDAKTYYEFQGEKYVIFAEGILDRREPEFARLWVPGTHFEFHYDVVNGLRVDSKGALSGKTRRNTAELIRYMGGLWLFGLWVRNPETPVRLCNRSIATAPGSYLITNITDLGVAQPTDYVMEGGHSKWLSLGYRVTPDAPTVKADGVMNYTFEVLDGKTGEVATDINWDGWRIEAIEGYAPHRRINVKNGVGRFRVIAMGLFPGESMRVKIQNRFDPSIAECTVKVV